MVLHCAACAAEREFEQPPCADAHGADCPEFACVECGLAILRGPVGFEVEVAVETRYVA